MKVDFGQYAPACKDYSRNWATFNAVLYGLCRQYPDHSDPGQIRAKIGIIGRSFATQFERKLKSTGGQGGALAAIGAHVEKHGKEVDAIFKPLAGLSEPLTPEKLGIIIAAQGRFDRLLRQITWKRQSLRSFASKYMHVHCPVVPIYDSIAGAELTKEVHWKNSLMVFGKIREADPQYHWFCARFWHLYQALRDAGKDPKVRLVDVYLLWMAE